VGFFLFILVNAALFIRPSEIIPDLETVPIYNILITSCLLVSFAAVTSRLTARSLVDNPISLFAISMLAAVMLSHLSHFQLSYARDAGIDFSKIILYYLLVVALLDSPARLNRFLVCLAGMIGVIAVISLLHYHGIMTIAAMNVMERAEINSATGESYSVLQLYGTGIFSDPNDLCLILTMGIGLSLYMLGDRRSGARWLWVVPIVIFAYTLYLTKSRGGFLAMLACLMTTFLARFGWKKTIPVAAVILPVMFVLFAGRQTDLSATSGTGQSRIQLWALSLGVFRQQPLFGLGSGLLAGEIGQEAHNSYLHCFADLGFFGGTLFIGMYGCAFWGLLRLGRFQERIRDPELGRLRPYLLGLVAGYGIGIMTLSRVYISPTYLVPGLVAAYLRLVVADSPLSVPLPRFDARLASRLVAVSVAVVAFFYVYVRTFARFG
jgi:putative inorganic carbon (hco3(-)) transporter